MHGFIQMIQNDRAGFTLVEMMVVIAIMGILVSLSAFGYRGWQTNVSQREAQSDLRMAATAMESAKNFGTGYTTSLPGGFKSSDKVNVSWVWGDGSKFCLRATSTRAQNINYYILNGSSSIPQPGNCPSAPFPPDEPNPSAVANSSSSVTVTWAAVSNATSYTVQSWIGTSSRTTRCTGSSTSCVISSLAASTNYSISVTASNSYGTSAEGTTSVTTQSNPVPGTPSPSAVAASSSVINVSWANVSGATGYVVRYGVGSPTTIASCTNSPCSISGLSQNTNYAISVTATNASGSSTPGTTSATTPYATCNSASYTLSISGLQTGHMFTWQLILSAGGSSYTQGNYPAGYDTNGQLTVNLTGLNFKNYSWQVITRDTTGPVGPRPTGSFVAC